MDIGKGEDELIYNKKETAMIQLQVNDRPYYKLLFLTIRRDKDNYYYYGESKIEIISFSNWGFYTRLPIENGLFYFIAAILLESLGDFKLHKMLTGCMFDFLDDKSDIDTGLRKGFICYDHQAELKDAIRNNTELTSIYEDTQSLLTFFRSNSEHDRSVLPGISLKGTSTSIVTPITKEEHVERFTPTNVEFFDIFVIMPFKEEFYDIYDGILEVAQKLKVTCGRADEKPYVGSIIDRVHEYIRNAKIIITEITPPVKNIGHIISHDHNPNVYYEFGFAKALNKPVIILNQNIDETPFDVRDYSQIRYKSVRNLKPELEKTLKELLNI
ncbi:MAG: hypothetical protein HQK92_10665 [Nitrospirae bacterium]|nr:hypothetical protein [Nitrospirota bacterium]